MTIPPGVLPLLFGPVLRAIVAKKGNARSVVGVSAQQWKQLCHIGAIDPAM
ncbi:MAG: hypothetical protein KF887_12545 [Paracoccaceae bacterium]|nr:MAG: hypothetical protein KF887_12545 [Paracoccaceae bacterium]